MNLEDIKGIGQTKKQLLNNINIFTAYDLLYNKPRSYEDRRQFETIQQAVNNNDNKASLVRVKVIEHKIIRNTKKKILKIIISDETLNASLVCFNQNYLEKSFPIGIEIIVYGKFEFRFDEVQCTNFEIVKDIDLNDTFEFGKIVPVYSLTDGLFQKFMRKVTHYVLSVLAKDIIDVLPSYILKKRQLIKIQEALWQLHFPSDFNNITIALKRLKYEELFNLQFNLIMRQYLNEHHIREPFLNADLSRKIIKELPFKLTEGQKNALKEIKDDLFSNIPMNRLIQGDVGSGKTLVAIITIVLAYENGYSSAFMVPTEVLVLQQYEVIKSILKPYGIRVDVLYSSMPTPAKKLALYNLKEGRTNVIVGTHSLFSENVEYNNLGLVIIDEQHKFGVRQRISLIQKGENVNILVMTATPIPRTITLTLYGDMKTTIIKDKPSNRQEIKTKVLYQDERQKAFSFAKEQVEKGKQCYVIYPLIEESDKINLSAANEMYEQLSKNEFANIQMGLLHGKMETNEKKEIMNKFISGKIKILVSTTVIEVGIDNPNATVMIIEHSDRFGLSQLHQLRGRIGRGSDESYCYLLVNRSISEEGKERMRAMVRYSNGFDIAEKDLEIRGPGEFFGVKQSGISDFKFADLKKDYDIIKETIEDCKEIIYNDPNLEKEEHIQIKNILLKKFENETFFLLQS